MNKEQLDSLLPQLEKYFENLTKEQLIKDIEEAGCSDMFVEVTDEEAAAYLKKMDEEEMNVL